jgi:hypothetical protein
MESNCAYFPFIRTDRPFMDISGKDGKSWDCTLAHFPYYELRKQCFDYIDGKIWIMKKFRQDFVCMATEALLS